MSTQLKETGPKAVAAENTTAGKIRKAILVTLALLAVYRVGIHLPVPGVDINL